MCKCVQLNVQLYNCVQLNVNMQIYSTECANVLKCSYQFKCAKATQPHSKHYRASTITKSYKAKPSTLLERNSLEQQDTNNQ